MSQSFAPLDITPSSSSSRSRVSYFYDPDVGNYVYYLGHPMKPHRVRMTHNLIVNYGLCDDDEVTDGIRNLNSELALANGFEADLDGERLRTEKAMAMTGARGRTMQVFRPRRATRGDMTKFHSDEYIEFLEKVTPETQEQLTGGGLRCLTGEDCPAFEGLFEFCSISAGGSLGAVERLNSGAADIAINWAGGLHHAKKTEASGFCYVNDIVLGILDLLRIHPRVLYIDVDVHHGDGVEEAFYTTDRVMTASFHRFGEFFPGTGDVRDIGMKRGKGYAVNVPMRDGIRDESFHSVFKPIIQRVIDFYRPGAIVLQMGSDSLAGDKLGGFNLTLQGHAECARFVKSFNLPIMMLGGGGYTTKNVARAWTNETAVMCDRELSEDLPYNQFMEYYGPRFKLEVLPNNTDDHNPPEYLEAIKQRVLENLRSLPHAPGVQISQVPSMKLSQALGMKDAELSDPEDEVDARVQKLVRKRQPNVKYSASSDTDSDGDPSFTRPARSRRQGGTGIRQGIKRRATPASESMDDDPCGVRRKRTFFRSAGEGTVIPPVNWMLGGGIGLGKEKAPVGFGFGALNVPVAEAWRDGLSRGGSPVSIM